MKAKGFWMILMSFGSGFLVFKLLFGAFSAVFGVFAPFKAVFRAVLVFAGWDCAAGLACFLMGRDEPFAESEALMRVIFAIITPVNKNSLLPDCQVEYSRKGSFLQELVLDFRLILQINI